MVNSKINDPLLNGMAKKIVDEVLTDALENPTSAIIRVVIVEPMKKPYKKLIPNTLEAFNEIVEGHMESMIIGSTKKGVKIGIVWNEEGEILKLPYNRKILNFDTLVGTFFITAYNTQGDNISLTELEADYYIKLFTGLEVYI